MKKKAYSLCKFFWIGLFVIIGWGVYSIHNWTIASYGLLWFFISIAPFSNIKRVQQEISERYAYVPNIGVMLTLAYFISWSPVLVTAFFVMFLTKLQSSIAMYQDDYWLVECASQEDRKAWYAWHIKGHKRWSSGSYKEALIMWVMAKMISPKEFKILFNLAVVLKLLKNQKESDEFMRLAKENIIPGQEKALEKYFEDIKNGKYPLLI